MIVLSSSQLANDSLNTTVCIVGSGAAGITLACELDGAPFNVLLLEAGDLDSASGSPDNYQGTAVKPHPTPAEFRRFGLGGSTSVWGGRCVPFDPIDFEKRDYIANSGWPISYDEVAHYYPRAMQYCDAGDFDFTASGSLHHAAPTIPGLENDSAILNDCIERYSLPTHFGKRYRQQLEKSPNVTVVLNARCVAINKQVGADQIESVAVVDAGGQRRIIHAQLFVLAVGGIETPRLLLAADTAGNGLGNRTDKLGRFYACHFENLCAKVVANGAKLAFDFEKTKDDVYCRHKLQFSAAAQHEHHLLNTAFRLHFPDYSDATHGSSVMSMIYLAKSVLIKEYRDILQNSAQELTPSPNSAHVRNVLLGVPQLLKFGWQWLFLRQLAERKLPYTLVPNADGSFPLEFNSEQTPLAHSRITLSNAVDQHGLQRVHVDWHISNDDVAAAQRAFHLLRTAMSRTPACRLEFDDAQLQARISRSIPVGGHHIGTARMAVSEQQGVVDTQCAVFGIPNLYLASSAVFPTSSHANPTLTIVALTLRLAEHLKATLANTPAANTIITGSAS